MEIIHDAGDLCVYCGESTAFGSGRFVNRISAICTLGMADESVRAQFPDAPSGEEVTGYACPECMEIECDACGEPIALDYDYRVNDCVYHLECIPNIDALKIYAHNYDLTDDEYNDLKTDWLETQGWELI